MVAVIASCTIPRTRVQVCSRRPHSFHNEKMARASRGIQAYWEMLLKNRKRIDLVTPVLREILLTVSESPVRRQLKVLSR